MEATDGFKTGIQLLGGGAVEGDTWLQDVVLGGVSLGQDYLGFFQVLFNSISCPPYATHHDGLNFLEL